MRLFWANAKTADLELLSTSDGFLKLGDAIRQFDIWRDYGYKLTERWVSIYESRDNGLEEVRRLTLDEMIVILEAYDRLACKGIDLLNATGIPTPSIR